VVDTSGAILGLSGTAIATPSQGVSLNDRGEISFSAGGTIFSDSGGQGFREVVRQNDILQATQVPGLSQDILLTASVNSVALNDVSQNLFSANFSNGAGIESGLFLEDANLIGNVQGSLEILVREGDAAPGTDAFFSGFGPGTGLGAQLPVLGNGGDAAFVSVLSGGGNPGATTGLFRIDEVGTIELVVRQGEAVSTLASGEFINQFLAPAINENGQVAFRG